jgi:hypothetical protein
VVNAPGVEYNAPGVEYYGVDQYNGAEPQWTDVGALSEYYFNIRVNDIGYPTI